jgi:hypothetical protein
LLFSHFSSRDQNVIFALVDPKILLNIQIGHGDRGHLSPWLEYPRAKVGAFGPRPAEL